MSTFVEECRREWKRLGVPDLMADEMATDLEADLAEARADGVSAAEMLGERDPRRFAASWARERGLVAEQQPPKKRRKGLWIGLAVGLVLLLIVALPALALITLGSSRESSSQPVQVVPVRQVSVPNVIGMRACRAVRTVARAGVEDWRIAGHKHGYTCDEVVVGQAPVGHVVRPDGHRVIVTLRLGRR
jgi:hypothetical protein